MAFYHQQPFYNPKIPFTGSIQGGLQEGKSIIISGRVLPGANRFHVNFQSGSRPDADIALHFNPRYDSTPGYVVTNTKQNRQWGPEERIYRPLFPTGQPFTLQVLVSWDSYKISVNGSHIMEYKHRMPFSSVDTVAVDGMVEINSIAFQIPVPSFPQPGFSPQYASPLGHMAPPSYSALPNYSIPYKSVITGGFLPGKSIYIQGVVKPDANRFSFNLRHINGIAFHYNPRFDENVVVRNTLTKESWGPEERSGGMPFQKGHSFQVLISCGQDHYSVLLNGMQVHTYSHRFTQLQDIDILEISGDLSLNFVQA